MGLLGDYYRSVCNGRVTFYLPDTKIVDPNLGFRYRKWICLNRSFNMHNDALLRPNNLEIMPNDNDGDDGSINDQDYVQG